MEQYLKGKRASRMIFLLIAIVFAICVGVQFFLAGMAIFSEPGRWGKHTTFAHLFGFNLPLFMLVFAAIGALPRWVFAQIFGTFVCVFLLYFSANMTGAARWIGALHPVIGIVLFVLSISIVLYTWKFAFREIES